MLANGCLSLIAMYCLADLFLTIGFQLRLQPSMLSMLKDPMSWWSSSKRLLPYFLGASIAIFYFPYLAFAVILCSKWPHPLYLAYKSLLRKNNSMVFSETKYLPKGDKLFSLDLSDKPHIIFVVLESFRAKNVGCLGAEDNRSPHFDQLAQNGILFTQFHSVGNLTIHSLVSSLLGVPPDQGAVQLKTYCKIHFKGLSQVFHQLGYELALIQGGSTFFANEADFLISQGFQTIVGKREIDQPGTSWGVFDEYIMQYASAWLENQKKPVFLDLYTITNHHPWIHPENKQGYLHTYAYTDEALGQLIDELRKKDLLKKSVLFIYADHGQSSIYQTNRYLTQEILHVPLLIYAEGRIHSPQKIDTVASQIDLLPTLCDLLEVEIPSQCLGKSLVRPSSSPIFFGCGFDPTFRWCREGRWKYLKREDQELLYDLLHDPEEKTNRIDNDPPSILHHLRRVTQEYFEKVDKAYLGKNRVEKESSFHLDLKDSLMINDEKLIELAKKHPELSSIDLSNCLMITDEGISKLFALCPKLETLFIDGLVDIEGRKWDCLHHLSYLSASNCPRLDLSWVESLPKLSVLKVESSCLTAKNLSILERLERKLELVQVYGG